MECLQAFLFAFLYQNKSMFCEQMLSGLCLRKACKFIGIRGNVENLKKFPENLHCFKLHELKNRINFGNPALMCKCFKELLEKSIYIKLVHFFTKSENVQGSTKNRMTRISEEELFSEKIILLSLMFFFA